MPSFEVILSQNYLTLLGVAIAFNSVLLLGSIGFYYFWHGRKRNRIAVNVHQPLVRADFWAVGSTFVCNVFVFILGVFCWKEGYLTVQFHTATGWEVVLELLLLLVVVDFWMYVFHKLAHVKPLYALIHAKHHEHVGVNALSLFVLSPFEAIGFGLMLLVILFCYPFHYISVGLYFLINVIWGTIGHFSRVGAVSNRGWKAWLGTANFHNRHHLEEQVNFGFYTTLWDRLFTTYKAVPGGEKHNKKNQ